MFHHFHSDSGIHTKNQGSIDKDDLYKMINFIGRDNILDANVFFEKFKKNKLKEKDVCLTFDDAVKSQIDIALPILEDLKIKSFFFVYTSIFDGKPDNLEFFRYFRMNFFNHIDEFYNDFYQVLDKDLKKFFEISNDKIAYIKTKSPYYSIEDIKFRLVRDYFLKKSQYEKIMFIMFDEKKFNYNEFFKKLYFQKDDLIKLDNLGHLIGLHSHNHPTSLKNLSYDEQKNEFEKCLSSISHILNKSKNEIKYMSHPCGSYNDYTLEILKTLGIELGFKETMTIDSNKKINNSFLEIARQNHAHILKSINS